MVLHSQSLVIILIYVLNCGNANEKQSPSACKIAQVLSTGAGRSKKNFYKREGIGADDTLGARRSG
jgi:hypothetical protein